MTLSTLLESLFFPQVCDVILFPRVTNSNLLIEIHFLLLLTDFVEKQESKDQIEKKMAVAHIKEQRLNSLRPEE